uniref:Uncharacterized protein n=1 Tax=Pyxicephalus adspersus TaxID=30357 RepID=A0AAV2ZQ36_PYXAD|nr:TPA: hypothetical protein GDO54_003067 [Pyxicephalus adspersus]
MDPNILIESLRGTMDPALREAAERQLNEGPGDNGIPLLFAAGPTPLPLTDMTRVT